MVEAYLEKEQRYFSIPRKDLLPFIPGNLERALDVGCGDGNFAELITNMKGCKEVWGIEPYFKTTEGMSLKLKKIFHNSIEDSLNELPDGHFDCIFFNDVLEHLVEPGKVLEDIKGKLRKDGMIIASIPNIMHFETIYKILKNLDWKYENAGIMDKTHLRFFTKKSIIRMFENSGYRVDLIQGINPEFGRKFRVLNFISGGRIEEMKYVQMVVRATPIAV